MAFSDILWLFKQLRLYKHRNGLTCTYRRWEHNLFKRHREQKIFRKKYRIFSTVNNNFFCPQNEHLTIFQKISIHCTFHNTLLIQRTVQRITAVNYRTDSYKIFQKFHYQIILIKLLMVGPLGKKKVWNVHNKQIK